MRLEGKSAVITGGAKGIGRETAIHFARQGAKVTLLDWDENAAFESALEINGHFGKGTAVSVHGDAANEAMVEEALAKAAESFGHVDTLVANAGVLWKDRDTSVIEIDAADWDAILAVNLKGPFLLTKHGIPHLMKAGGGSIILIGGVSAFAGSITGQDALSASKSGLKGLAKSIAVQFGPEHIRCNVIHPGLVDTPGQSHYLDDDSRHAHAANLPLRRLGQAGDIAPAAVFLASEESSWMTGTELILDGGFSAG